MQRKSVTEERAETWKAYQKQERIAQRNDKARLAEYVYLLNVFFIAVFLMSGDYLFAAINFIGALGGRSGFYQELRGYSR